MANVTCTTTAVSCNGLRRAHPAMLAFYCIEREETILAATDATDRQYESLFTD